MIKDERGGVQTSFLPFKPTPLLYILCGKIMTSCSANIHNLRGQRRRSEIKAMDRRKKPESDQNNDNLSITDTNINSKETPFWIS